MDARFLFLKQLTHSFSLKNRQLPETARTGCGKKVLAAMVLAISASGPVTADSTVLFNPWDENNSTGEEQQRHKHVVQTGESLSLIADMYGIPAALLAHHNGLPDPESIMVGQVIYLPGNEYPEELLLPEEPTAAGGELAASQPMLPMEESKAPAKPTGAPGNFDARPYAYFGNSEPAAEVLKNFAANYSIPVIISPGVDGVVNGRIGPHSPVEFLNEISQLHGLIWYFDGNTLYVYSSNEIEKQILNLEYLGTDEFRKTLMEIGIWDSRFYWKSRPSEGIIYLSGPPRYMELVSQTARLLDAKSGDRQRSRQTVKVFPLRYAWADDRTFNYRNKAFTVPGVATTLRQIVQGGGISAPPAAPSRSLQGMKGATPAGPANAQQPAKPQASLPAESVFINADRRLNAVIIHDLESKMPMYESLINTLDKPLAQVEISVSIIDINTNSLDQLGINWRLGKTSGDFVRFNPFKTDNDSAAANTFSTIINISSGKLLAQVNLLSDQGNAKILSRPSVLTLDNMEAVLDNSQTFYVKVAGQESAELFPVTYGSVLQVTPRIVDEVTGRKLHLSVNIQDGAQAANTQGADNIPVVKNSSISTQAVIDESESLLIGGYFIEETTDTQTKIPFLGDMPFVGAAFRNKRTDKRKNVRLFLITPRIVNLM